MSALCNLLHFTSSTTRLYLHIYVRRYEQCIFLHRKTLMDNFTEKLIIRHESCPSEPNLASSQVFATQYKMNGNWIKIYFLLFIPRLPFILVLFCVAIFQPAVRMIHSFYYVLFLVLQTRTQ